MNTPHPQAEILRAIADGKTIQARQIKNCIDEEWFEPYDAPSLVNDDKYELRIKPDTININGHEVPEPVREPLQSGAKYWIPRLDVNALTCASEWQDFGCDKQMLERGLIHLTKEAATAHADALLSFTRVINDT